MPDDHNIRDADGRNIGSIHETKGILGDTYWKVRDKSGQDIGTVEKRHGILGDTYYEANISSSYGRKSEGRDGINEGLGLGLFVVILGLLLLPLTVIVLILYFLHRSFTQYTRATLITLLTVVTTGVVLIGGIAVNQGILSIWLAGDRELQASRDYGDIPMLVEPSRFIIDGKTVPIGSAQWMNYGTDSQWISIGFRSSAPHRLPKAYLNEIPGTHDADSWLFRIPDESEEAFTLRVGDSTAIVTLAPDDIGDYNFFDRISIGNPNDIPNEPWRPFAPKGD